MNAPIEYLLRLADNGLILSHRLAQWAGHGPVLEEDIALSNIALDLLGQARLLYQHAATLDESGGEFAPSEDRYAYFRDVPAYRNVTMLELPNGGVASAGDSDGDYAFTIVRNALYSAWALLVWETLQRSTDPQLAGIAGKAVKETRYHVRHANDWMIRLGDGTEESHRRTQHALTNLLPYTNEWFAADPIDEQAVANGSGVDPSALYEPWAASMQAVAAQATLHWPKRSQFMSRGKQGLHSEHLGYLIAEMQSVARQHPGAVW